MHAAATYVSLAVLRDGHLIFYRTRGEESEGSVADLVHQTAMFYEDRLQGRQFARVLLAGGSTAAGAEQLRQELSRPARRSRSRRWIRSARRRPPIAPRCRRPSPTRSRRHRHPAAGRGGGVAMLTGNLATRPFYNERLVRGVLIVALAAAAAWAAVNVATVMSLSQQSAMLSERVRSEGLRAAAARTEADRVRRGLDAAQLQERGAVGDRGQSADPAAHLLVDRALQPVRGHAARRRAARAGAAADRRRRAA